MRRPPSISLHDGFHKLAQFWKSGSQSPRQLFVISFEEMKWFALRSKSEDEKSWVNSTMRKVITGFRIHWNRLELFNKQIIVLHVKIFVFLKHGYNTWCQWCKQTYMYYCLIRCHNLAKVKNTVQTGLRIFQLSVATLCWIKQNKRHCFNEAVVTIIPSYHVICSLLHSQYNTIMKWCHNTAISKHEFLSEFWNCPLVICSHLLFYAIQALCDIFQCS